MKNLVFFLLLVIFVTCPARPLTGLAVVGPLTQTAFSCLYSSGYDIPIVRVYTVSGSYGVDPNADRTMINAYQANPYALYGYMQMCRGYYPGAQVVDVINSVSGPYTTIFAKIEPNNNPDCTWDGYTQSDNCQFIQDTISAIQQFGLTAGVFSTANIWQQYFGNSCDFIASSTGALLWYANYETNGQVNSVQSYDDFTSFGGWTTPFLKQTGGNMTVSLCNNPVWNHAFIDQVWGASN